MTAGKIFEKMGKAPEGAGRSGKGRDGKNRSNQTTAAILKISGIVRQHCCRCATCAATPGTCGLIGRLGRSAGAIRQRRAGSACCCGGQPVSGVATAARGRSGIQSPGASRRQLHDSLRGLGVDKMLADTATRSGARQRLTYIAQMTEQARSQGT